MMTFKNRAAQIIKLLLTGLTFIALPVIVAIMMTSFLDLGRITIRTVDFFRPAQLTNYLVTLRIIN